MHLGMTNMVPTLSVLLESILLFRGGTMTIKELSGVVKKSVDEVKAALLELKASLAGRGTCLIEHGDKVALGTAPEAKEAIEQLRRDELDSAIGRAGLETLAVIVYQGHVTRADIEYIRGVNVTTSLRSLVIRGLVERFDNPKDKRSFLYRATPALVAYFGLTKLDDLPGYKETMLSLANILAEKPAETMSENE